MVKVRTVDFLPEIFQTPTNAQFLGATLDQLVSQPKLQQLQGFIGENYGPGINPQDTYIPEITPEREHYQLTPAVTFLKTDTQQAIDFLSYPGILSALKVEGGDVKNPQNLFNNQFYSWDPFVDYDKLVNYTQYYWMPEGPNPVTLTTNLIYGEGRYKVSYTPQGYKFNDDPDINPSITLIRESTYTFEVDQATDFWIQGDTGTLGYDPANPNLSTREILGVTNNGANKGTVTFTVPRKDAQQFFTDLPGEYFIDLVTNLTYDDFFEYNPATGQNDTPKAYRDIKQIDGIANIENKSVLIWKGQTVGIYRISLIYKPDQGWNRVGYSPSQVPTDITGLYDQATKVILTPVNPQPVNFYKITAKLGDQYAGRQFYRNAANKFFLIPYISANKDILYYQDGTNPNNVGIIYIVDNNDNYDIVVDRDIIGKKTARVPASDPNGVVLTNGLKVKFEGKVIPESYLQGEYYVEGVGTAIQLIPTADLDITGEPFLITGKLLDQDYITIGRQASNRNAWSRSNRWFHQNVINTVEEFNTRAGKPPIIAPGFNAESARGKRPIIEFRPNLSLFNQGITATNSVTWSDVISTDALSTVNGLPFTDYHPDGPLSQLSVGDTIIFLADVSGGGNKLFTVGSLYNNTLQTDTIVLNESYVYEANVQSYITNGTRNGNTYYYEGVLGVISALLPTSSLWRQAQKKVVVNQEPLFDVFDTSGTSFSNTTVYPNSTFTGCRLLGYARGMGTIDPKIGFALKYVGVGNLGDIEFAVYYNTDTFTYTNTVGQTTSTITEAVNTGDVLEYTSLDTYGIKTGWQTAIENSIQYQVFKFVVDVTNYNEANTATIVVCDIPAVESTNWAPVNVYLESLLLDDTGFSFSVVNNTTVVTVNEILPPGTVLNVLVYSNSVSANAYFEIPQNLQSNPLNEYLTSINAGDIRVHYQSIYRNLPSVVGPVFGANNIHDQGNVIPYGTKVVQNSASMVLPAAFLRQSDANFFNAIKYNAQEYQKFKNILIDTVNRGDYTIYNTPAQILDDAIQQIGASRSPQNAFYWSDMLPSGTPYISNTYTFRTTNTRTQFTLSRVYSFTTANYNGVQIYVTRVYNDVPVITALVRGIDYEISPDAASAIVTYTILPGDTVTVNEYNQTWGSYCPNTPSKLGIYPRYAPKVIYDATYLNPTYFIRGHDGSLNKLYGAYNPITGALEDFRDQALLEFEKRIYNNAKTTNSNRLDSVPVPLTSIIPGRFRSTDYTYEQTVQLNVPQFINWVGQNRIDYESHYFLEDNSFTWNYRFAQDTISNTTIVPGYWRGIYKYFYDTDHPHDRPWELLGFIERPLWWVERYGDLPYTSDNTLLWGDLAEGIVWNGGDPYVAAPYVRPGLLQAIPVNSLGELLPPNEALTNIYDLTTIAKPWIIGDQGPAETSYYNSSQWPFDAVRLMALSEPAKFFNYTCDIDNYKFDVSLNQWVYQGQQRIQPNQIPIYGSGTPANSFINWIIDYERQYGLDATGIIKDRLDNLDVRLVYRLAGFSSHEQLNFYVERSTPQSTNNSLLIPEQNYQILLYNNQPFDRINYSAVIVQKTTGGWAVFGNSQYETYFKTVRPVFNGIYETITQQGLSVQISTAYNDAITFVPYGTVFTSPQEVSEFIINYGRYLENQGCVFEAQENTVITNWQYSISEFLYWVRSGWSVGSTLCLNPAARQFVVNKDSTVVQPLTLFKQNFVLNQNLLPVANKDISITRQDTLFSVTPLNEGDTVAYTNLNVSNIEHAIVFDNETYFNDIIYDKVTGLAQGRILVRGTKTAEWNGSATADGFIINRNNIKEWSPNVKYTKGQIVKYKNRYWVASTIIAPQSQFQQDQWLTSDYSQIAEGLLPNPSTRSVESLYYYDINRVNIENDGSLLSYSLIGFRPRTYFVAANMPDTSQVNVYLDMIRTKGTTFAAKKFDNADFAQGTLSYQTYENWAIKAGVYGGVSNQNYIEYTLNEDLLTGNPAVITVVSDTTTTVPSGAQQAVKLNEITNYGRKIYNPDFMPTIAPDNYNADTVLPSAGYANYDDMKYYAYNIELLSNTGDGAEALNRGNYIWIADDNNTWQVYTPIPCPSPLTGVVNNLNGTVNLLFQGNHGLAVNNRIAISDYDDQVNGYYVVLQIINTQVALITLNLDPSIPGIEGQGIVQVLSSQRVALPEDIDTLNLLNSEFNRNKVWVDTDTDTDWAVYEKSLNYTNNTAFNTISGSNGPGTSSVYTPLLGYIVSQGVTGIFTRFVAAPGGIIQTNSFPTSPGMGTSGASGTNTAAFGNPIAGVVNIYSVSSFNTTPSQPLVIPQQVINSPNLSLYPQFGSQVCLSGDDLTLFIADGANNVWVYTRDNTNTVFAYTQTLTVSELVPQAQFGAQIVTNYTGSRVIITAPQQNTITTSRTITETGAVFVFDRLGALPLLYFVSQSFVSSDLDQGIEFGRGTAGNRTLSEVLVGAPYRISQVNGAFVEGSVHRYTDLGKLTGVVSGRFTTLLAPVTLYINGLPYNTLSGSPSTVAGGLNAQNIPNIIAMGNDVTGDFVISLIDINNAPENNKLSISGSRNDLSLLGINIYTETQTILNPHLETISQFGYDISSNGSSFIISAPEGNQFSLTTFDYSDDYVENDTIFDHDGTLFVDNNDNLGAVYMFDYLGAPELTAQTPGKFIYSQTIHPDLNLQRSSAKQNYAVTFAYNAVLLGTSVGAQLSLNSTGIVNWHVYRKAQPIVDTTKLQNIQIYNRLSNSTELYLDIIDPLNGRLLGVVEQNIDYIGPVDPAGYEVSDNSNPQVTQWNSEYVGRIWLDTSAVRWVNYHQQSLDYNSKYFATVFPGSVAPAYTWISSLVTPDQYAGPGTPYSTINYTSEYELDSTGALAARYFFWVSDSTIVSQQLGKTLNAQTISRYVLDPQSSGISYCGALNASTIALYNSSSAINDTSSTLHIGIKYTNEADSLHTQYDLIRDGDPNDFLAGIPQPNNNYAAPSGLYSKFLDSLSGRDAEGRLVPDPLLPELVQTGISVRPRQTMFRDNLTAVQNYMGYANTIMAAIPVSENKSASYFNANVSAITVTLLEDAFNVRTIRVSSTANLVIGMPLVINNTRTNRKIVSVNSTTSVTLDGTINYPGLISIDFIPLTSRSGLAFNTPDYWQYVDWYAPGYSASTKIVIEVRGYYLLQTLASYAGLIVKVSNNGQGNWEIYDYTGTEWVRVGLQNGTIQILPKLWAPQTPENEPSDPIYWITRGLVEQIYTNEQLINRNASLMLMFNYIVSEADDGQNYLPWLNKTSFLDVFHGLRELTPNEKYQRDNVAFLEGYLNEVKPYHVYIKDFALVYKKTDVYQGYITDFDLPSQYNVAYSNFYSPQLVYSNPQFNQYLPSNPIWQSTEYTQWFQNQGLQLSYQGQIDVPVTTIAQFVNPPIYTQVTREYALATTTLQLNSTAGVLIGQYITDNTGAIPDLTYITTVNITTNVITISAALSSLLTPQDTITIYEPIYVDNGYSMLDAGVFRINDELISYTFIDRFRGELLGLTRGYGNTIPTIHDVDTPVLQTLPPIHVLDGARGYDLANPPRILALYDRNVYGSPREEIVAQPNITSDGRLLSVDVFKYGSGYPVQPLIYIDPPFDKKLSQYFSLADVNTTTNSINLLTPKLTDPAVTTYIATSSGSRIYLTSPDVTFDFISQLRVGQGILYTNPLAYTAYPLPPGLTITGVFPATENETPSITVNVPVSIPAGAALSFVHQFITGDPVRFTSTDGSKPPLGLFEGRDYYLGTVGGKVTSVIVTSPGNSYAAIPTVLFIGGGGSGAYASAALALQEPQPSDVFPTFTIDDPGYGYVVNDIVVADYLDNVGARFRVTATYNNPLLGPTFGVGLIQSLEWISGGVYTSLPGPAIETSTTGSGQQATVSLLSYTIAQINIQQDPTFPNIPQGGTNYTTSPAIRLVGGGGTSASAIAIIDEGRPLSIVALYNNKHDAFIGRNPIDLIGDDRGPTTPGFNDKVYKLAVVPIVGSTWENLGIRENNINLTFDRITYGSDVNAWQPYVWYAGYYTDYIRQASTSVVASIGLEVSLDGPVLASSNVLSISGRSGYVNSATYNITTNVVVATFVTGFTTSMAAPVTAGSVLTVASVGHVVAPGIPVDQTPIRPGMVLSLGNETTSYRVISVNVGSSQVTIDGSVTLLTGEIVGFSDYDISLVAEGDYFFDGVSNQTVSDVDTTVHNRVSITFTSQYNPQYTTITFVPNIGRMVNNDVTKYETIIVAGDNIRPGSRVQSISVNALTTNVTIFVPFSPLPPLEGPLTGGSSVKFSLQSVILESSSLASNQGITLEITQVVSTQPAVIKVNWLNPDGTSVRVYPSQILNQPVYFFNPLFTSQRVEYYLGIEYYSPPASTPIQETLLRIYLDPERTRAVTSFPFSVGDFCLIEVPLQFNRSVVSYRGTLYRARESNNDDTFQISKWEPLFSRDAGLNAYDRIAAYYVPTLYMPNNPVSLMSGLEYPNSQFAGQILYPDSLWDQGPATDIGARSYPWEGWDIGAWDYREPTEVRDLDTILKGPPLSQRSDTTYFVSGGIFEEGYAPEELVAGYIQDTLTLNVKTRPGATWDPLSAFGPNTPVVDHTGYTVVSRVFDIGSGPSYSFADFTGNPLTIDVFIDFQFVIQLVPQNQLIRAYEVGTVDPSYVYQFTVDWLNKTLTVFSNTTFPDNARVMISVNELGGGSQLVRTSSDYQPFVPDSNNTEIIFDVDWINTSVRGTSLINPVTNEPFIPPIVYNKGHRILYKGLTGFTITDPGTFYNNIPGLVTAFIDVPRVSYPGGDIIAGGLAATAEVVVNPDGTIGSLIITDPGYGYATDGTIGGIAVVNRGAGYTSAPTVTIEPPVQAAQFSAIVSGGIITDIIIDNGGYGHTSDVAIQIGLPNVGLPYGGIQATASVTLGTVGGRDGVVTGITITNPGAGYTSTPLVTTNGAEGLQPGASTATAIATLGTGSPVPSDQVASITLLSAGAGYTFAPQVTISLPTGSGAIPALAGASLQGLPSTYNGGITLTPPLSPAPIGRVAQIVASGVSQFEGSALTYRFTPTANNKVQLTFNSSMNPTSDYLSIAIFGETTPTQNSYTAPFTQSFIVNAGQTIFPLKNFAQQDNPENAVVELNGRRVSRIGYRSSIQSTDGTKLGFATPIPLQDIATLNDINYNTPDGYVGVGDYGVIITSRGPVTANNWAWQTPIAAGAIYSFNSVASTPTANTYINPGFTVAVGDNAQIYTNRDPFSASNYSWREANVSFSQNLTNISWCDNTYGNASIDGFFMVLGSQAPSYTTGGGVIPVSSYSIGTTGTGGTVTFSSQVTFTEGWGETYDSSPWDQGTPSFQAAAHRTNPPAPVPPASAQVLSMVVGSGGTILYCEDPASIAPRWAIIPGGTGAGTTGTQQTLNSIAYSEAGDYFMAVGNNGTFMRISFAASTAGTKTVAVAGTNITSVRVNNVTNVFVGQRVYSTVFGSQFVYVTATDATPGSETITLTSPTGAGAAAGWDFITTDTLTFGDRIVTSIQSAGLTSRNLFKVVSSYNPSDPIGTANRWAAIGYLGQILISTTGLSWTLSSVPETASNSITYSPDDDLYATVGNFGTAYSIDAATYSVITTREFDPAKLEVSVNGILRRYDNGGPAGGDYTINFAPPTFKTLFDGELAGRGGRFNAISFDTTTLFVVFNYNPRTGTGFRPPAGAVVKMVYETSIPAYLIDDQRLIMIQQISTGDIVSCTTYNYTLEDYFETEFFTGATTSPIIDIYTPESTSSSWQPARVSTGSGSIIAAAMTSAGVGYTSLSGVGGDTYTATLVSTVGGTGAVITANLLSTASVTGYTALVGGSGYLVPPVVTISFPYNATEWVTGGSAILNDYYYYNNNIYRATTVGTFGAAPPQFTSGTQVNGTVTLQYTGEGTRATATAELTSNSVSDIIFTDYGSGYVSSIPPTITITPATGDPGLGASATPSLGYSFDTNSLELVNGGVGYTPSTTTITFPQGGTPVVAATVGIGTSGYEHELVNFDHVRIQGVRGPQQLNAFDVTTTYTIIDITKGSPAVVTVSTNHSFYDGLAVRISGVVGTDSVNNRLFYVKTSTYSNNKFALYTNVALTTPYSTLNDPVYNRQGIVSAFPSFYVRRISPYIVDLYYDPTLQVPVRGLQIPLYEGGGFIWKYQAFMPTQPQWKLFNTDRLWVTIDGSRVSPQDLVLYPYFAPGTDEWINELGILTAFDSGTDVVVTSMSPQGTVGELDFSITVAQNIDSNYNYQVVGVEILASGSSDWGVDPTLITVTFDEPNLFGGTLPRAVVTLQNGAIKSIVITDFTFGKGYSFIPGVRLEGPGTRQPVLQAQVQQLGPVIGIVRNQNQFSKTWLTENLQENDALMHVYDVLTMVDSYEVVDTVQVYSYYDKVTGTTQSVTGVPLPYADYTQIVELLVIYDNAVVDNLYYSLEFLGTTPYCAFTDPGNNYLGLGVTVIARVGNTVSVGGEIIKYTTIDTTFNTVGGLERGYENTTVLPFIPNQTTVQSRLPSNILPVDYWTESWVEGNRGPLQTSDTPPALFLQRNVKRV